MAIMETSDMPTFEYSYGNFEPCDVFPDGSRVCRPYVRAVLHRDKFFSHEFEALIDTGADYCTFPAHWLKITDEEWGRLPSLETETIKGDKTIRFMMVNVYIEKLGDVEIYAGLTKDRAEFGILGHHGFLEHYKATLDPRADSFTLERYSAIMVA